MKLNVYEKKKLIYIVSAVCFILLAGIVYFACGGGNGSSSDYDIEVGDSVKDEELQADLETLVPVKESVIVHVSGAVVNPGVYEIGGSMRVGDAIEAAGGLSKNASDESLNLAGLLTDGEKITVLTKKQAKRINKSDNGNDADSGINYDGLININTASKEELMTLQGIGEAKADSVIEYRKNNGGFKKVDELMEVPGIKEGIYANISQYITVK